VAEVVTEHADVDAVFCPQYRLSAYDGQNPFPAALQDTLTSYLYLTRTLNIPAENIVLSGDSAGGNLVIAFLRYLASPGVTIPAPRCALLFSAWVSPSEGPRLRSEFTKRREYNMDYVPVSFLEWGWKTYTDGMSREAALDNPYIELLGKPFASPVPVFINYGTAESLGPQLQEWTKQMKSVDGQAEIEVNVEEGAVHDTLLGAQITGFEDSMKEVVKKVAEFLKKH
jgi:acetyl esterase/lipase